MESHYSRKKALKERLIRIALWILTIAVGVGAEWAYIKYVWDGR